MRTVNYRLWAAIFVTMSFPAIYQAVRIYFLGNMPDDWGINIASQLSWVNLFYEIIQEALILPLFFLLGNSLNNKEDFENKVKSGLILTGGAYTAVSAAVIVFARPLVVCMAQNPALIDKTVDYIRIETVATLFSAVSRFMTLVFITLKKDRYMYIVLASQTVFSILLDILLISDFSFSLNMGVNGIAAANIIVHAINAIIAVFLLRRERIKIFSKGKISFGWMKEWFRIGAYSGLESLLRNLAFMVMIIRMVNLVAESGAYWIANNFIWNWLLVPALALADLIKKETGEDENAVRAKTFGYIVLTGLFAVLWLVSIPFWKPFLAYVMNAQSYETVFGVVLMQTGFYILFMFNSICDSTFYGLGKTHYMLIQSVSIDVCYYGVMFALYLLGIFVPTLTGISLMFGIGMTLDFIPTLILYIRLLKKKNIQIDFRLA